MATEKLRDTNEATDSMPPAAAKYAGALFPVLVVGLIGLNVAGAFGQSNVPGGERALPLPGREDGATARAAVIEQPLDMESLKQRLRDTGAIGVFSKIALRNQMDDLITQFRVHYATGEKSDIALLRPPSCCRPHSCSPARSPRRTMRR